MTEHINLETVEAYLASIALTQGNLLPSPMVILSDENPLYDEPGILEEMETALAEERPAKIDAEITNIENYNSALITVTFNGAKLENSYRINVPRQLVQVGYMYNRLLHAPACSIITESEARMNKDFNSDDLHGEFLPPLDSEEIMVRLIFPKDMAKNTRLAYNYVLNNLSTDFTEGLSKEELSEIAPKIRLVVDAVEASNLRGNVIEMILGLVEGNEDALVRLYEYAEKVDSAKASLEKNALLSDEEREAVIIFEYMAKTVDFLYPENLIRNISEIEQATTRTKDEVETNLEMEELFPEDFQSSLDEIITGFRQNNPDTVTLTEDSTYEDRIEYLSMPSNVIPLMGGLVKLSDRLNVDYYYSVDWNRSDVTEDEFGTRGEFMIALAMLAVQRIHMFAKSLDVTEGVQQMKSLALSLSTEALTQDQDIDLWFLKESLQRAAKNDTDALNQFLIMSLIETPKEYQIHSPFGQIMHWFGHIMVEEEHTREEMLTAYAKLPIITEFVETLYDDADEMDDDDDDDEVPGGVCFVNDACLDLPYFDGEPNLDLAWQVTNALVIFAGLCLSKDDPEIVKNTPEWEEALSIYLKRVLTDD